MSKRYLFPMHLDAGNRGCEAIALGTIKILGLNKDEYWAFSKTKQYDIDVGLEQNISYYQPEKTLKKWIEKTVYRILLRLTRSCTKKKKYIYTIRYKEFLDSAGRNDMIFVTGGDMLCYGNNEVNYITNYANSKGKTVVLWGASVGKDNLTPEKDEIIKKFSFITARESLTYDLIKNYVGNKNVYLAPDPAFVLKAEALELPFYFDYDCVGINLSNFVNVNIEADSLFGKNIINLIKNIIEETKFHIVLIPHVFWEGQDDRHVCRKIMEFFGENEKLHYLDTEKLSYCQIRYVISKCRFFIGARTHSMISAYSMKVPALALGYSVKSKGIAKDLGMPKYTVIDYRELKDESEIKDCFIHLEKDEDNIRKIYEKTVPLTIQKAYEAKEILKTYIGIHIE